MHGYSVRQFINAMAPVSSMHLPFEWNYNCQMQATAHLTPTLLCGMNRCAATFGWKRVIKTTLHPSHNVYEVNNGDLAHAVLIDSVLSSWECMTYLQLKVLQATINPYLISLYDKNQVCKSLNIGCYPEYIFSIFIW